MAAYQAYARADPQAAASSLIRAIDDLDVNHDRAVDELVSIVADRSWQERREIVRSAHSMGRDVIHEVKAKTKGDFEKGLLALLLPAPVRDAEWIHNSITGLWKSKDTVREVLFTRTTSQLEAIAGAYLDQYGKGMVDDVLNCFSGRERKLTERLLGSQRPREGYLDIERARALAQELHEAGPARWGTDEGRFIDLLTMESVDTVRAVFREYESLYGRSLFDVMGKEFHGNFEKDLLMLSQALIHAPKVFADVINKAMKGIGTDEDDLIRAIIARKDIDLPEIKRTYEANYGKPLGAVIEEGTRGDFKKLLMAVVASI